MLQTLLMLMKSLNKTETPIFLFVVCSLFPKAIFLTFILFPSDTMSYSKTNEFAPCQDKLFPFRDGVRCRKQDYSVVIFHL